MSEMDQNRRFAELAEICQHEPLQDGLFLHVTKCIKCEELLFPGWRNPDRTGKLCDLGIQFLEGRLK